MRLRHAYTAGILLIIFTLAYTAGYFFLERYLVGAHTVSAVFQIAASIIMLVLMVIFFAGFAKLGKAHSNLLNIAARILMALLVLGTLLSTASLLLLAALPNSTLVLLAIMNLQVLGLMLMVAYAIFTILFGVGVRKLPVESSTKNTLSVFSILEGASILSLVGMIFYPYFAFENYVFRILLLKDTIERKHDHSLRNRLWIIIPLILYILFFVAAVVWLYSATLQFASILR